MKAAFLETPGTPDVIRYGDLPTPTPKQGEVLVKVGAAAVNPIDLYIRAGTVAMPLPKPFIVGGSDLAGVVAAVGPGATRFQVGQRVWGSNQGMLGRQGTFAEFACVHEDYLYPTPPNVADPTAAAAALTGITAHLGLFQSAHLKSGETLFVHGGTGGVGSMVLQMAKASGAKVVTTVGSAEKAEICRKWGADRVLNYKTDDLAAAVKEFTAGRGLDVWFETQREPDFMSIVPMMAPRGRIVLIAGRTAQPLFPVGPFYVKGLSLFGFAMFNAAPEEQRPCAEAINRWLESGKLQPAIGRTFPLAEAAAAHRFLEENTVGKVGSLIGKVVVTM